MDSLAREFGDTIETKQKASGLASLQRIATALSQVGGAPAAARKDMIDYARKIHRELVLATAASELMIATVEREFGLTPIPEPRPRRSKSPETKSESRVDVG